MFSVVSANINIGPNVTAVGHIGPSAPPAGFEQAAAELTVPWQCPFPGNHRPSSLLSWHSRLSDCKGRDEEMGQLRRWAEDQHPIWVRFLVAEGGTGKSRLAAEFADEMQSQGWAAGFVKLRKPQTFQMNKAGTFLVVDYPEEHPGQLKDLLEDLAGLGNQYRIRVLLLTRQSPANFDELVSKARAENIVDNNYMVLSPLSADSATEIYNSTVSKVGDHMKSPAGDDLGRGLITAEAMEAWMKDMPENERPLFITAAAVQSAFNPSDEHVRYSGRDVVMSLAKREADRLDAIGQKRGYKDQSALSWLSGMATIAGGLPLERATELIEAGHLPLGLDGDSDVKGELQNAGMLEEGRIPPLTPDIVAAAFVHTVLAGGVNRCDARCISANEGPE